MKVSVIVPIYKVEKYIHECVDSILKQTFSDFELVLVDDGSPDNCPKICDDYAKTDKRVRVVHKENGGLVSAWKAGVEVSSGEYIAFIDGDDFVDEKYLETLIDNISDEIDLVCMNCKRYHDDGRAENYKMNALPAGEYEAKDLYDRLINDDGDYHKLIANTRWAKLFKGEAVRKNAAYCSSEVVFGEDQQLTLGILYDSQRVKLIEEYGYYYRFNQTSIVNTYKPRLWERVCLLIETIEKNPKIQEVESVRVQLNTQLLLYLNECLKNEEFYGKGLKKKYFLQLIEDARVKRALQNYMQSKMGRLDKKMLKNVRKRSYIGLKFTLFVYSTYCMIRGYTR